MTDKNNITFEITADNNSQKIVQKMEKLAKDTELSERKKTQLQKQQKKLKEDERKIAKEITGLSDKETQQKIKLLEKRHRLLMKEKKIQEELLKREEQQGFLSQKAEKEFEKRKAKDLGSRDKKLESIGSQIDFLGASNPEIMRKLKEAQQKSQSRKLSEESVRSMMPDLDLRTKEAKSLVDELTRLREESDEFQENIKQGGENMANVEKSARKTGGFLQMTKKSLTTGLSITAAAGAAGAGVNFLNRTLRGGGTASMVLQAEHDSKLDRDTSLRLRQFASTSGGSAEFGELISDFSNLQENLNDIQSGIATEGGQALMQMGASFGIDTSKVNAEQFIKGLMGSQAFMQGGEQLQKQYLKNLGVSASTENLITGGLKQYESQVAGTKYLSSEDIQMQKRFSDQSKQLNNAFDDLITRVKTMFGEDIINISNKVISALDSSLVKFKDAISGLVFITDEITGAFKVVSPLIESLYNLSTAVIDVAKFVFGGDTMQGVKQAVKSGAETAVGIGAGALNKLADYIRPSDKSGQQQNNLTVITNVENSNGTKTTNQRMYTNTGGNQEYQNNVRVSTRT